MNEQQQARVILREVLVDLTNLIDSDKPIDVRNFKYQYGLCAYVHHSTKQKPVAVCKSIDILFKHHLHCWARDYGSGDYEYPISVGDMPAYELFRKCIMTEAMWRGNEYAGRRRQLIDYIISEVEKEIASDQ